MSTKANRIDTDAASGGSRPIAEIENLAHDYAEAYARLGDDVEALENGIRELKRKLLPLIKRRAIAAADAKTKLHLAVAQSPGLFERPKTRLLHGVKVGFVKSKGRVEWDDEAAVIKRIRKHLPEDQAELLIRVRESIYKQAIFDLCAADLKRLGIEIAETGDQPVVSIVGSDVEKIVDALLRGDETTAEVGAAS